MDTNKQTELTATSGNEHSIQNLTPNIEKTLYFQISGRPVTCRILTDSEIESYAQFGRLSTIFLTFFGLFIGIAFSCVVALIQGNMSVSSQIILQWLGGGAFLISIIFLSIAITLIIVQKRYKKMWE